MKLLADASKGDVVFALLAGFCSPALRGKKTPVCMAAVVDSFRWLPRGADATASLRHKRLVPRAAQNNSGKKAKKMPRRDLRSR
jgi:hypothetical protein